ncbi:MAG: TRAP transporter small permease [Proteobacteria bacterium]|nr:TRAP transporter small permease [Pseudomonadota bacterium]
MTDTTPDTTPREGKRASNGTSGKGLGAVDNLVQALRRVDRAVGLVEQTVVVGLLAVLIGVGAAQAVVTQLGASWDWAEEIIRYAVFFIAMAGAALSAHTGQLIAMDFVTRLLQARRRAQLRIFLRLFTLSVCALLIVGGLIFSREIGAETNYHIIPPGTGLLALPLGAGLIGFHVTAHLAIDFLHLVGGQALPEHNRPAAH